MCLPSKERVTAVAAEANKRNVVKAVRVWWWWWWWWCSTPIAEVVSNNLMRKIFSNTCNDGSSVQESDETNHGMKERVMGARLLLAYCRRFFLRVSVWLYVWVSLSQRKTHTPKDERERERETETVCFIVWHKGGWVQQVDLLYPEWLWWPLGSNTDQTI